MKSTETTRWEYNGAEYWKTINGHEYSVARGFIFWHVGTLSKAWVNFLDRPYLYLADAKRAAHEHAEAKLEAMREHTAA